jgi:hypothetical protein
LKRGGRRLAIAESVRAWHAKHAATPLEATCTCLDIADALERGEMP